ncbi:NADase-type glycan-binding domain-containing protein [Streptomyces griseiscabiei]|uniref:Zinc ribbon domain-containing protein n=1 Tax=Streptomyces griseiscabiei TaxID=2993540 RepID=A0ABU4LAN2_9ACTN|nr:zinc ribbon domain-containing protein [Streptomyces griseiscabiei]MBZ3903916.1 zinc ribbon domain-containing protein [Streptomyces griseiscabiei]MDX2912839.1 zinc ribbon domain-containing protein [Streptomyces griseiscabiei]
MTSPTPGTGQAQSCAECGTRGEPGQSFCDACGAVLGWSGTPARATAGAATADAPAPATAARTTDPAPAPAAAPDGAAREPGWDAFAHPGAGTGTARTGHDTGGQGTAAATVRAPESATTVRADAPPAAEPAPAGGTATAAPPAATPEPAPAPHPRHDDEAPTTPLPTPTAPPVASPSAADRARSLLVPVADPEPRAPAEPAVAPVLPGRPDVQRPQVRTPGPEFGTEGGVPCPWCGTPTRPDRHFCARCAMPMAGRPQTPGRLPWWRRVLNGRNTETPWAGDRPRLRRGFGAIMNWVVAAVVLALVVTLAFQADDGYQAARDHFAKRTRVYADTYKASRSFPGHKPKLAFDNYNNTWWGPGVTQSGEGEWIEAHFEQPLRLLDVVITPGVSKKPDQLADSARPHRIEATITAADGTKSTKFITLDQTAGAQSRKFRVGSAETVRFTIRSSFGADDKKQVAIAEIEFFGRSSGSS